MQNVKRARDDTSTGPRASWRRQRARPASDPCPADLGPERELFMLGLLFALIAGGGDVDGRDR